jgi:hypothetical protein
MGLGGADLVFFVLFGGVRAFGDICAGVTNLQLCN